MVYRLECFGTLIVVGPLILSLTLRETHRYAGPIYRIEMYLKKLCAGEDPGPLELRKKDHLKDIAQLLGEAVQITRSSQALVGAAADAEENQRSVA